MAKKGVKSENKDKGEQILIEMLSHLLYPERAKEVAQKLLLKFGSFSGIVDAQRIDIAEMGAMYEGVADFLGTVQKANSFYLEDQNENIQRIYDSESSHRILKPLFIGRRTEVVALLLLDGRSRVLYNEIVNEGSISEVPIYIRRIMQLCLSYSAYDAVIAHNHPSGNPLPSKNDLNATSDLEVALNSIEVNLSDHIIITESDYLSLSSSEWLKKIKRDVAIYRKALRDKTREEEAALLLGGMKPSTRKTNKQCADISPIDNNE